MIRFLLRNFEYESRLDNMQLLSRCELNATLDKAEGYCYLTQWRMRRGCKRTTKTFDLLNPDKMPENPGKILKNLGKIREISDEIPENLGKMPKNPSISQIGVCDRKQIHKLGSVAQRVKENLICRSCAIFQNSSIL